MLKTNSKEVMNRIKKLIMESYESAEEYYTFEGKQAQNEYNDICKDIVNTFCIEKRNDDCMWKTRRISEQDLFYDWMSGLPTAMLYLVISF